MPTAHGERSDHPIILYYPHKGWSMGECYLPQIRRSFVSERGNDSDFRGMEAIVGGLRAVSIFGANTAKKGMERDHDNGQVHWLRE